MTWHGKITAVLTTKRNTPSGFHAPPPPNHGLVGKVLLLHSAEDTPVHLQHVLLVLQHAVVMEVQVSTALVSLGVKEVGATATACVLARLHQTVTERCCLGGGRVCCARILSSQHHAYCTLCKGLDAVVESCRPDKPCSM